MNCIIQTAHSRCCSKITPNFNMRKAKACYSALRRLYNTHHFNTCITIKQHFSTCITVKQHASTQAGTALHHAHSKQHDSRRQVHALLQRLYNEQHASKRKRPTRIHWRKFMNEVIEMPLLIVISTYHQHVHHYDCNDGNSNHHHHHNNNNNNNDDNNNCNNNQ